MTDKPETAEPADDDRVVVRRISREALYRMRPDLRPSNDNRPNKAKAA